MKFFEEQLNRIKLIAVNLIDDHSNIEYTRGICELIADLDGKIDVDHEERSREIKEELLTLIEE